MHSTKILIFIIFILFNVEAKSFKVIRICNFNNSVINDISWTIDNDTCDNFLNYYIYGRPSKDSSFRLIDSSMVNNFYSHNTGKEPEKWDYYIGSRYLCGGSLNENFSDTVGVDRISPPIFNLDSVSVIDGKVFLGWSPNPASDVMGYRLQHGRTGSSTFLDNVLGRTHTQYIDSFKGNPSKGPQPYRIAAYDSCDNISPLSTEIHTTIYLESTIDSCANKINLSWSAYESWEVNEYRVLISTNAGFSYNIQIINSPDNRTAVIKNLKEGNEYCFKIRAVKKGDPSTTSSSNVICLSNDLVVNPQYIYLSKVSVYNKKIRVNWAIDKTSDIKKFIIYRGETVKGQSEYKTFDYNPGTSFTYVDSNVDVSSDIFFYKIQTKNICDSIVGTSNTSSNVRLSVTKNPDSYLLNWNFYTGWAGDVGEYYIYRSNGSRIITDFSLVNSVLPKTLSYKDNLNKIEDLDSGVCYFIKAKEAIIDSFGFREESNSNIACVFNDPIVYVPSAFNPLGANKVFRPEGVLIDYRKSDMKIYNRWGVKVFETDDLKKGWDGTIEGGELASGGVYVYVIRIRGLNGKPEVFKGIVTLLR